MVHAHRITLEIEVNVVTERLSETAQDVRKLVEHSLRAVYGREMVHVMELGADCLLPAAKSVVLHQE